MTKDRLVEIIKSRNNHYSKECLDKNCKYMYLDDLGMNTTLAHCEQHGWQETVAGKVE